ncbi:MAG TPA: UDP-N-acetylglucosamine 2-epimerase (non-hydrolyzing), partial [Bacteroidota bacterium]|nr:UDP-N-acetylglucosamine 2-epimerase (non-hydrolyzing) [Bacteroidota bacterium]
MITIISVVGARPNFMKIAPIARAFKRNGDIRHVIVHTGQHYDDAMSEVFFRDLEIPEPEIFLGVGSGTHAVQTAKILIAFERVVSEIRPDAVIVVGDVNSTLACSLVCAKMSVPVAHVEAGLRSFDRTMPEEVNRIVTDAMADWLFVSEPSGVENLRREGIPDEKVFFVGNVMIDTLVHYRAHRAIPPIVNRLGLTKRGYVVMTMHRPGNVDTREDLERLVRLIGDIAAHATVVFPMHPRTKKMLVSCGLLTAMPRECLVTEPMPYGEFITLCEHAACVVTDSGGIQEETTYLGVPCITMRKNTERPITVTQGTNTLMGERYGEVAG